jgi:hypothetical protein
VNRSIDRADWQEFARPGFGIRFRYPAVTPRGQAVDRAEDQRGDAERVHLTTPEQPDLYFEVTRFPGLAPRDEYRRHRDYLEQRFGAGSTTELAETRLGRSPAWSYAFRWDQGERSVLLLPVGQDTYRIIYDPRSPLNAEVLATVTLPE